tara:strand:+ start:272 stop:934 length:663 start_codon:yes stop_codon:yes gene_type:complete
MTSHPFDLKGIDTGQIGGNKYVDYKLSDFLEDQNLKSTPKARDAALRQLKLDKDLLQAVPSKSIFGKIDNFLAHFTGKTRPQDYYLPTSITNQLAAADKTKKEKEVKDPLGNIADIYEEQMKYEREMNPFNRKSRVLDSVLDFVNLQLQTPFLMDTLKDASTFKQQQLLDAEAIKQGLPNARQSRMLAADTGAAQLRQALAAQQDAATRFAGLGMQRRFG